MFRFKNKSSRIGYKQWRFLTLSQCQLLFYIENSTGRWEKDSISIFILSVLLYKDLTFIIILHTFSKGSVTIK